MKLMRLLITVLLLSSELAWASPKNCGTDVPPAGYCEGDNVVWCEGGVVKTLSCPAETMCAWNEDINAFDCVVVTNSCSQELNGKEAVAIPVNGICDKIHDRVLWCDAGKIKMLECKSSTSCGWNSDIEMMDCVKDGCAEVPKKGQCSTDKQSITWCNEGELEVAECENGTVCTIDDDSKEASCMADDRAGKRNDNSVIGEQGQPTPTPSVQEPGSNSRDGGYGQGTKDTVKPPKGCHFSAKGAPKGLLPTVILMLLTLMSFRRRRKSVKH